MACFAAIESELCQRDQERSCHHHKASEKDSKKENKHKSGEDESGEDEGDDNSGARFFRCSNKIITDYQKKWIINTTVNSLSAAYDIAYAGDIVKVHPSKLDTTYDEAYRLAKRMWGQMNVSYESMKQQLTDLLENLADVEISMHRHLRSGKKTESAYLAGCASQFADDFPLLCYLHQRIEHKTNITAGGSFPVLDG